MKLSYAIGGFVFLIVCVGWRLGIGRESTQINAAQINAAQMRATDEATSQSEIELRASLVELALMEPVPEPIAASSIDPALNEAKVTSAHAAQDERVTEISETAFESLSYCNQMDALDRAGKSVSEFVLSSGLFSQYDQAQQSECPWHRSQLDFAYRVLYPPSIDPTSTTAASESGTDYDAGSDDGNSIGGAASYDNQAELNAERSVMPPPYRLSRRQWLRYQQRRVNQ
jgi:hypothetical protein